MLRRRIGLEKIGKVVKAFERPYKTPFEGFEVKPFMKEYRTPESSFYDNEKAVKEFWFLYAQSSKDHCFMNSDDRMVVTVHITDREKALQLFYPQFAKWYVNTHTWGPLTPTTKVDTVYQVSSHVPVYIEYAYCNVDYGDFEYEFVSLRIQKM